MDKELMPYYLSRIAFSIVFGFFFFITGSSILNSLLFGSLLIAAFLWAPHSGRYSVHPEFGITALRRDEYTQTMNDTAARNAFVAVMLAITVIIIIFSSFGAVNISIGILKLVIAFGALAYFVSDFWLRKIHQ